MAHIEADHARKRTDSVDGEPLTPPPNRRGRQQTIKRRVIRLVLVPSVVAVVLWLVASGYLVFQGFYNREVASSVRKVSIPAVTSLASIQQERRLSIAFLANPSSKLSVVLDQRRRTDRGLSELRAIAPSALARAPESIQIRWRELTDYLDRLPDTRSTIDSRSTDAQGAAAFYSDLLDAATNLFDTQARVVPDVTATQGGIAAVEIFRASDLMSRAGSTIDGAFASGTLSAQDHLDFARQVGTYHSVLTNLAPNLRPNIRKRYESVALSDSWKDLVAAENAIIAGGAWRNGVPRGLPADPFRWEALTRQVSDELIKLTIGQADEVSAEALRTGNNQLLTASLLSLVALSIAIGAIMWAIRQSRVLVDRALSIRLARLGEDAAAVVDQQLPVMMDRLRRRERVDLSVELPTREYGSDEIGRVADVINRSLQAAAGAAVNEAKARAAGTAMLMGVARRPQRPLQHGLKVVEDLQSQVGDEQLLAQLFDLNHQMTQTRRFLENLIILAGGQIGRRFRKPVPLRRVLLAAFSEARHYQRITLRNAVDASIVEHSVAGTIHLLSELLDNALAFSSPETLVWVTCVEVSHGIAVEIEDAGVGMNSEAIERANTLLTTAHTPDVTELRDGAQVGLHVVAELAKREKIKVNLRRSAYGGLLAVVLIPNRMLVTRNDADPALERTEAHAHTPVMAAAALAPYDDHHLPAAGVMTTSNGRAVGPPNTYAGSFSGPAGTSGISVQPESPITHPVSDSLGTALPDPHAVERPPLPQRQPQQHLAPELCEDSPADAGAQESSAPVRSPEETRNRFARYQRGWTDGQASSHDETITSADQGRKA